MGQATSQIEAQIVGARAELGANLHELEQKMKSATDWKYYFRSNPMPMLGVAIGGGLIMAAMFKSKGRTAPRALSSAPVATSYRSHSEIPKRQVQETWDAVKLAVIGVATAKLTELVGEHVPGFQEHFLRAEAQAKGMRPIAG